jgi:hypothetical protein
LWIAEDFWWYITEKPYYEDALDDADDSKELLN